MDYKILTAAAFPPNLSSFNELSAKNFQLIFESFYYAIAVLERVIVERGGGC